VASDPPLVAELPADQAAALDLSQGAIVAATWSPEAARLVVPDHSPPDSSAPAGSRTPPSSPGTDTENATTA